MGICLASRTRSARDCPASRNANRERIIVGCKTGAGMTVGKEYPPEWREYTDPLTRRRVRQLTDSPAEEYHFYFYNPTITPDGKYLIFISERTGMSNLF